MKLIFIGLLIILTFAILPRQALAQFGTSETCVTQVGTPGEQIPSPGPLGCTKGTGSTELLSAAAAIKSAYDQHGTPAGATYEYSGLADNLSETLRTFGYSDEALDEFEIRRGTSLVDSSAVPGGSCTECLGFIGIVAALSSGTSDCEKTLCSSGNVSAGAVLDRYKDTGFQLGNGFYVPIGQGVSAPIQPGDIALTGSSQDAGHIAIVYQTIPGNDVQMYLFESNGYIDCRVTADRITPKDDYVFFRKQ